MSKRVELMTTAMIDCWAEVQLMIRSMLVVLILVVCTLSLDACASSSRTSSSELCPMCKKPVDDGPEVRVVRAGEVGEGTRYRCFVCPIMQGETGDDWTMRATTGLDGKLVVFHVHGDTATSEPPTAVVLALPVAPGAECLDVHRVFADRDEFDRYAATHPLVKQNDARSIDDVLAEMHLRASAANLSK